MKLKRLAVGVLAVILLFSPIAMAKDEGENFFGLKPYIPDIEVFMQIGSVNNPRISPDGKTIFYISNLSGVSQIYRISREEPYPYQLTFMGDGVDSYSLSPDGKWIVFLADRGGNEQHQFHLMDSHTGRQERITDDEKVRFSTPLWTTDTSSIYFSANMNKPEFFSVYRMDLKSRKISEVYAEKGHFYPVALSSAGKNLLISQSISNRKGALFVMDMEKGTVSRLTPEKEEYLYYGIGFSPDGGRIYCLCNRNEEELMKLATLDIDSKKLEFIYDRKSPWEVDYVSMSRDGKTMALVINEEGYGILKLVDLVTLKDLPVPDFKGIVSNVYLSLESIQQ